MIADRGMDMEAGSGIIRDMLSSPYGEQRPLKDITSWFVDRHGMTTSVRSRQMDRKHYPKKVKPQDPKEPRCLRDTDFRAAEARPVI
jgi:hypothetical protein